MEENIEKQEDLKEQDSEVVEIKESDLANIKNELESYKDRYVRLYAEFENARKRMERDKQEFIKFANAGLISDFLNILDNLERSVDAAKTKHQDYEGFIKGIEMVMAQVYEFLKKNGLTVIEAKGKKFDPHCHEVLMQEESDSFEEGTVLDEFQKGYKIEDRVIRTAKVKLAKAKEISS